MHESAPSEERRRVAIRNVGCKLNQYESEALSDGFQRAGYDVVGFDQKADIYVVNTCTVTGAGDADSRRAVRQARRHDEAALVVATGCYAQRRPDELTDAGASLIVANGEKAQLVDAVTRSLADEPVVDLTPAGRPQTRDFLEIDGLVEGGRTRGTLQIQDGCDEHCTYCIIPQVRGISVSRPVAEILAQARRMVEAGYVELALTGVHTGSFGYDQENPEGLVELLVALEQIEDLTRIRLNSIEPNYVSDDLIDFAATSTRLCRHYHIPLQSGDNDVLRRMGRGYNRDHYADRILQLAAAVPDACFGADVMVGFPGETQAQFGNTLELLHRLPMTYLHAFSYSLREGTPAQRLPDHAPREVKSDRARQLIEFSQQRRLAFHQGHVGRQVKVLIERERRGDGTALAVGTTDNYIRVLVDDGGDPVTSPLHAHQLVEVRIDEAREDIAFGTLKMTAEVAA